MVSKADLKKMSTEELNARYAIMQNKMKRMIARSQQITSDQLDLLIPRSRSEAIDLDVLAEELRMEPRMLKHMIDHNITFAGVRRTAGGKYWNSKSIECRKNIIEYR